MKLVFIGIQGSGKGTQGKILKEKFWFKIFETGGALRKIAKEDSELWKRIKKTIELWNLLDIKTIWDIIWDFLDKNNIDSKIIFDWIPRNKEQKDLLDSLISEYKVVLFDLTREVAEKRLLGRMYNPKSWETFISGILFDPKTWDKLEIRKDDNQEAIKQRIDDFYNKTIPIIEEYESEWKLIKINADNCIESVTIDLEKALWL